MQGGSDREDKDRVPSLTVWITQYCARSQRCLHVPLLYLQDHSQQIKVKKSGFTAVYDQLKELEEEWSQAPLRSVQVRGNLHQVRGSCMRRG